MVQGKYDAVIFDLFGTLIDELTYPTSNAERYMAMMSEVSRILEVDRDELARRWRELVPRRAIGEMGPVEETFDWICREMGSPRSPSQIDEASRLRLDYIRGVMTPRPDSVPTIQTIKSSGLKVGLISDCSEEIARFFPGTPIAPHLDTAILSCEVGIKKPDPKIFGLACERLGVEPGRCIYVGDGNSTELTGASAFGMDAVLIRAPYDNEPHGREDWTPRISSVSQVLGLIAGAP